MKFSPPTSVTIVFDASHPEPGERGVVLDVVGDAWQRFGPAWYSTLRPLAMLGAPGRLWSDLVGKGGPVLVLALGEPTRNGHPSMSSQQADGDAHSDTAPAPDRLDLDAARQLFDAAYATLRRHAESCAECAAALADTLTTASSDAAVARRPTHLQSCETCAPMLRKIADAADDDEVHRYTAPLRMMAKLDGDGATLADLVAFLIEMRDSDGPAAADEPATGDQPGDDRDPVAAAVGGGDSAPEPAREVDG